jgi:hypothetical protein
MYSVFDFFYLLPRNTQLFHILIITDRLRQGWGAGVLNPVDPHPALKPFPGGNMASTCAKTMCSLAYFKLYCTQNRAK